jgi:DNA primase catalytic core
MARIPDKEIERLKQEVSIQSLAEARGVILRQRGDELMGLCPFHEDHSPSLVINVAKNVWHCLGACQSGGSVIDWVMKAEGVSFRHAVELLRKDALSVGAVPPCPPGESSKRKIVKRAMVPKLKSIVNANADVQRQIIQVLDYYHDVLKDSPEALSYLENRGLKSAEMVAHFRLGYSNRTLGYRIPFKAKAEGAAIRGSLQECGILRASGHEHFWGSLVIPVFDENGYVTEVYGRKLNDKLRASSPLHLYLPGPHRGVWNIEALQASREIILCESLIDALTFWCAGFRHVTASYGVGGFTDDHRAAFKKYRTERVYLAYDRDEPGDRAASSLAAELMAEGIECFRVQFPRGMDANEYALKVSPAKRSLDLVIRQAVWLGKGQRPEVTTVRAASVDESSVGAVPPCPPEKEKAAKKENDGPAMSPLPPAPQTPVDAEVTSSEVTIEHGDRRWRIRGLEKNLSYSLLKVNLLVGRGDSFHVDTFDLYSARQRQLFIKQASGELEVKEDVIKRDLGKVLLKLEELQEQQISRTLEPAKEAVTLSESEQTAAMELLTDPNLLDRILADFEKCGIVGEETNKLVGYLAAVSRKLEEPLAIVIQSSSAAGKSSLMEAILSFFPLEERVQYSAMTGQSLFYMGEADLQHKILAIAEEEGAEKATYALKLLQSEGELTIASTGKDPATGRLETQEYRVEGPVMIFLTTTAIEIDEELLNRCIVLTVDEEREQTRAIHRLQRERQTLEGLLARRDSDGIRKLHQDGQRLLRPLLVANPFARELTFLDDRTRTRRDHMKYLTLIRSIALLHQHQRPIKQVTHQGREVAYIEVTLGDIETANRLAHHVLGRSLDELAPQTRRLLIALDEMVTKQCAELGMEREDFRFTRREVREHTGIGFTQARVHMARLVELEYVLVHRGGRGQSFVYELLFDGSNADGTWHLDGLIEPEALKTKTTTSTWRGSEDNLAGGWRPHDGPMAGGWRSENRQEKQSDSDEVKPVNGKKPKNAHQGDEKTASYIAHHTEPAVESGASR